MLALHVAPMGHWSLHPPQFNGSAVVSTHPPPQSTVPAAQALVHAPSEQTRGATQALSHAPQLLGSLRIWVHAPPLHPTPLFKQLHTPVWHEVPAPHAALHPPQLALSVFSSTHPVPHADWPAGQAHAPPEHAWPEGHSFPQAPQLSASVIVSMHSPPQNVWPAVGHTHAPATHAAASPQDAPQAPQFAPSFCSFTQAPLQSVSPDAHCVPHAESEQTPLPPGPPGQTLPHWPQFVGLDARLTHWPAQKVGTAGGHSQAPEVHCWPTGQAFPHPLQLAVSLVVSTHAPLQSTRPAAQTSSHEPAEQTSTPAQARPQPPQL